MLRRFVVFACLLATSMASASEWKIQKNVLDASDKSKSTFIAATMEHGHALAVRCIDGKVSFAVSLPSNAAAHDQDLNLKIVADRKEPITATGKILDSNIVASLVEFGDASTAEYLTAAKKFSLRTLGAGPPKAFGFTGGKSFDDSLTVAATVCGIAPKQSADLTTGSVSKSEPQPKPEDCSKQKSCYARFGCLAYNRQLGDKPNAVEYINQCKRETNARH